MSNDIDLVMTEKEAADIYVELLAAGLPGKHGSIAANNLADRLKERLTAPVRPTVK
jgi:hypothetical protein